MKLLPSLGLALVYCVTPVRADTLDQIINQAHLDYRACSSQSQSEYQQCVAPCGGIMGNPTCVNACFNVAKAQTNMCRTNRDATIQQAVDQAQSQ
jgi:hypothetical protein